MPRSRAPVRWPLSPAQGELVATLASLVRRGGRARFSEQRLVAADATDFPDAWDSTLSGLDRLLKRVAWHAYFDIDIVVRDIRPPKAPDDRMLKKSELELLSASAGSATFELAALGNDDIAGPLRARDRRRVHGARAHRSVSRRRARPHRRRGLDRRDLHRARGAGRELVDVSPSRVARRRPLGGQRGRRREDRRSDRVGDATLLLRCKTCCATRTRRRSRTLLPPQTEWLSAGARCSSRTRTSCARCSRSTSAPAGPPLTRPDAPRAAAVVAEPESQAVQSRPQDVPRAAARARPRVARLSRRHGGARDPRRRVIVAPLAMMAGATVGYVAGKRFFVCSDPECRAHMLTEVPTCPRCGGTILERSSTRACASSASRRTRTRPTINRRAESGVALVAAIGAAGSSAPAANRRATARTRQLIRWRTRRRSRRASRPRTRRVANVSRSRRT